MNQDREGQQKTCKGHNRGLDWKFCVENSKEEDLFFVKSKRDNRSLMSNLRRPTSKTQSRFERSNYKLSLLVSI